MDINYHNLSDEELDSKIENITSKINIASRMGQDRVVEQLLGFLEELNFELLERVEGARFKVISDNTPDSFVLGEDDDTDAPANE